MAGVTMRGIRKNYEGGPEVIRGIDLDVRDGEFMVFVGPSGCGKSTLMRMIAGLEEVSDGELRIGGRLANHLAPAKRGVAMVFQSYALYPHMTVEENMGFSLRLAGAPRAAIREQVARAAEVLQLSHVLSRKPKALSGGQRQRVAIGRAIVRKPDVFLFDEPLSNLDAGLRVQMRVELSRLHRELGNTMIYVTHDQTEAMTMGDRIAVFHGGQVEQVGRPMDLYAEPANVFVAQFLGSPKMNVMNATCKIAEAGTWIHSGASRMFVTTPGPLAFRADLCNRIGVRPESVQLLTPSQGDVAGWDARIDWIEQLGDTVLLYARIEGVEDTFCVKLPSASTAWKTGDSVRLCPQPGCLHLFAADGTRLGTL